MPEQVLLWDALTNAATGIVYAVVGWRLRGRAGMSPPAQRAWQRFLMWWYALSCTGFLAAVFSGLAYAGVRDVALYATLQYALVTTFAIAMACLVYYVVYLWTGMEWTRWPIRALYVFYTLAFVYEISASRPAGIVLNGWRPVLEYETPFYPGFLALSFLFLFLPQTIVSLTYLALVLRAESKPARRRVLLVAVGVLTLSAGTVVISRPMLDGADWLQAAGRAAVIAAALAILAAYLPESTTTRAAHEMQARRDALDRRVRDLV